MSRDMRVVVRISPLHVHTQWLSIQKHFNLLYTLVCIIPLQKAFTKPWGEWPGWRPACIWQKHVTRIKAEMGRICVSQYGRVPICVAIPYHTCPPVPNNVLNMCKNAWIWFQIQEVHMCVEWVNVTLCVCMRTLLHIQLRMYVYVCVCVCVHATQCVYVHINVYVRANREYVDASMCTCMCVYTYKYVPNCVVTAPPAALTTSDL